jgi:aryl-alcohol dehydrogenase-like predicted oxidoreductase
LEKVISLVDIDIVQLPLNIFDQRFVPMLAELKKKNIEIHTRSTFLQGLLFMDANSLNPYFEDIKQILAKLPENRLETALNFVNGIKEVDKIVVGVTKKEELQQIVKAIQTKVEPVDFDEFIIKDERFILPQNWRLM